MTAVCDMTSQAAEAYEESTTLCKGSKWWMCSSISVLPQLLGAICSLAPSPDLGCVLPWFAVALSWMHGTGAVSFSIVMLFNW